MPDFRFAAWQSKCYDGSPNVSKTPDSRISLSKSQPISSKIDIINQRNQYNRINHSNHNLTNNYNNNNNNRISNTSLQHYKNQQLPPHLDPHNPDDLAYQTTLNSPNKYYYKNSQNSYSSTINSNNPTHSGTTHYYTNNRSVNETNEMDDHTITDNRQFTERRKKTVRFDGQDSDEFSRWENERQGSQDSTTKDSGIDTSSTFTSSEDSNRGDLPKVYYCKKGIKK